MSGVRLGIDVGTVRIGVAASDPAGVLATPVATVPRAPAPGPDGTSADVALIAALVRDLGAIEVIVGLPLTMAGTEGAAAQAARAYASEITRAIDPVPVRLVDERLSTVGAHRALHAAGRPGRRHRGVVDQVAAVTILQSALDARRSRARASGDVARGAETSSVIQTPDDEVGPA